MFNFGFNLGRPSGSTALAQILYDMNITQSGPVLGDEEVSNGDFSSGLDDNASDWVQQSDWLWNSVTLKMDCNTASVGHYFYQAGSLTVGETYRVTFEVSNHSSGGVKIGIGSTSTDDTSEATSNGTYTEDITIASANTTNRPWVLSGASGFVGSVDNISIKVITEQYKLINQGATGATNDAIVLNATQDGAGSILVDGTTDIDTYFKPNLDVYSIEETVTGELQDFGVSVVPNGTYDTGIIGVATYYPANIDFTWDATLQALRLEALIVGGSTTNIYENAGNVFTVGKRYLIECDVLENDNGATVKLVGSGIYLNVIGEQELSSTGHIAFTAEAGGSGSRIEIALLVADIGDVVVIDNLSCRELTTKTLRTEARILTHTDTIPETKYYINGLIQDVTPPVPDADTIINLGNTSIIGYSDTIDSREANFEVWDEIKTATDALDSYNQWVLDYQDALTDGEGAYLTDEHGRYLYA